VKTYKKATGALFAVLLAAGTVSAYKSTSAFQLGPPGAAMQLVQSKETLEARVAANEVPAPLAPAAKDGLIASKAYKNVPVMGHITSGEFTRLMTAMTIWVAPQQGCGYCHAPARDASGNVVLNEEGYPEADLDNMQSDELYTKRVSRRMLQMTQHINASWGQHVKQTGVTCWTCHRGNNVPTEIWFDEPASATDTQMVGYKGHQNAPAENIGLASLPSDALRYFLASDENIRVQSADIFGAANDATVKRTEWTYSLMTHMSLALGVNCTYCHNSRSWSDWSQSPQQRATAWYGIRMVRNLNAEFLEPLLDTLPPNRHGRLGDAPKANCATCHQGAYKPLLGVSMLGDYPELAAPAGAKQTGDGKTEANPKVSP
jgi:photosynthetic reaction center cytochrome c subunit